jgi:hypothetical protein
MTVGPSMLATILSAPSQWTQVLTSMPTQLSGAIGNSRRLARRAKGEGQDARSSTRLRRCAQAMAAAFVGWAVVVVRFAVSRGCLDGSPSAASHGVTCE